MLLKVLHMATDSEEYRQAVFREASINYCYAVTNNKKIPNQFGISRSYLQKTVLTM